ncbi:MAG: hypothetical protein RBT49_02705 [Bacteroidales bacterium]|jgi:hypothetical protein|nr:hypothetical protein [Bacteroidales bacterium]
MKSKLVILSIFIILNVRFTPAQTQIADCNRSTNYKEYKSLLPIGFCMPEGYWAVDVFEADINSDDKQDRLIKYYKKDWKCADTIFLAVFFRLNDTTFKYAKTFSNLYTPLVENYSNLSWLVENCTNEYMSTYAWENQMWLRFEKGVIIVPFAINEGNGFDFYFTYDTYRKNWYLTQQQRWYIQDNEYERKYLPDSKIEKVENGISINSFRIKDYLQPW